MKPTQHLTTVAALPSGAGQAAHLAPEVSKKAIPTGGFHLIGMDLAGGPEIVVIHNFLSVANPEQLRAAIATSMRPRGKARGLTQVAAPALPEGELAGMRPTGVIVDELGSTAAFAALAAACMGDAATPADKQGFEPTEYTERN
ncbi:hypothetical protein [Variovorax ginsengisoli]|uniref:Uncharacterized protein n=1 Tax=Variovorax ginsengisoli TaxID=363844 RepID=A0ABT8SE16_9BURK|nr:hypothetical protein [Variovorax ginsengisoli]MDN8617850.1 hypothetical protein [Variovorax ginsengisoli]MDO1537020.1 hypothetical protein [Variovorax ginsengisoli]